VLPVKSPVVLIEGEISDLDCWSPEPVPSDEGRPKELWPPLRKFGSTRQSLKLHGKEGSNNIKLGSGCRFETLLANR
jgi:hypothetical protein